jgi:hypothetical protein
MAGLGEIELLDAAIVADTQWERKHTRKVFKFYKTWAENHGIPVEIVTAGKIRELGATEHIHIPFWTETGAPLQRQCTSEFKIKPIKRGMRHLAGFSENKSPHPRSGQFESWIGISWDEWERMSTSEVKYITNRYPLVERKITRWDCEENFKRLGLPIPSKSACIGCPYRDATSWLEMKNNDPDEFEDAIAFDEANRHNPLADRGKLNADNLYVWHGCIPLRDVDFETEVKKQKKGKQVPLFVCTGQVCWT